MVATTFRKSGSAEKTAAAVGGMGELVSGSLGPWVCGVLLLSSGADSFW